MKKIVLIKQIDNIQAGHLYEHIFCMQLAEFFRAKGLYSYLDYDIDAKTFYSGYVKLEVSLFSKAALRLEKLIPTLSFAIDEDTIDGAVLQVMAEKSVDLIVNEYAALEGLLNEYAHKSWVYLDSVKLVPHIDVKDDDILELIPRSPRQFLVLKQVITMDAAAYQSHSKDALNPLFVVISQAILQNLQQIIADTAYCYSYEDFITRTAKNIKNTNLYRIDKRQNTKLTIEKEYTEAFIKEFIEQGFVEKLETYFKKVTHSNNALVPNDDYVTESTGVLVGAKGWRTIGTQAAIRHVLRHTTIDFNLGQTRQSVSLADYL